jgi:hypothetical protein
MPYDPRYHQRTSNLEDEIAGYDEDAVVVKQQRTHRPARNLRNAEQAVIAERLARQQAIDEARARQRSTRLPPNAYPKVRQRTERREDDELYEDEDLSTRPPRSAVRYQPEEIYRQGNKQVNKYTSPPPQQSHAIPQRRSAQYQPPPAQQQERYTEGIDELVTERPKPRKRPKISVHALVWLGLGMIVMIVLWIGGNYLINWWQIHQDDSTYGRPRTFQIDAVVGHHDSTSNPSHFIAVNLNRHAIVIEIPGGDASKARIYPVTTLFGDGQDLTPVTLSFKDVNGDGLVDLEIHIQDQTLVMLNENGSFRPLKAGERVHL